MRSSGVVKVSRGGSPMWVSARFLKILLVCVGLFFIYDGLKKVTDKIDVEAFKNATAHFEKFAAFWHKTALSFGIRMGPLADPSTLRLVIGVTQIAMGVLCFTPLATLALTVLIILNSSHLFMLMRLKVDMLDTLARLLALNIVLVIRANEFSRISEQQEATRENADKKDQ